MILAATNLHDAPALMSHAVHEAKRTGARLLLVHVIPPVAQPEDASANLSRALLMPTIQSAADTLEHLALQLQWQGVLCEPVVLKGRPDEQISQLVQSRGVDRVFVAARSRPSHGASPSHSLAALLIRVLPVPVCVVGNRAAPEGPCHASVGRVLLALSLRSMHREFVDFACGLARARQARLTLLHVIDPAALGDHQAAHDAARFHLAALAASHDDLPWSPEIAVRDGDPATQIVEEAACPFQDLIVLGSAPPGSSGSAVDSPVIHQVIAETRCPVMVLKPLFVQTMANPARKMQVLRAG